MVFGEWKKENILYIQWIMNEQMRKMKNGKFMKNDKRHNWNYKFSITIKLIFNFRLEIDTLRGCYGNWNENEGGRFSRTLNYLLKCLKVASQPNDAVEGLSIIIWRWRPDPLSSRRITARERYFRNVKFRFRYSHAFLYGCRLWKTNVE